MITVTGTENLLMAATLAEGETVLENAAREPEVTDLANLLVAMGAKIDGIGTDRLVIQGVDQLHGAKHAVISDRIEAATFLCAVAATGGDIRITNTRVDIIDAALDKLREIGLSTDGRGATAIRAHDERPPAARDLPHHRISRLPDRHAGPVHGREHHRRRRSRGDREHLRKPLHARAGDEPPGRAASAPTATPPSSSACNRLVGAPVMATDLRASASLVIAGLAAEGTTIIDRIYHLDRGYDRMEAKLSAVGADIVRIKA